MEGSSPLARGLRRCRTGRPWVARDHPRSRGVYPGRSAATSPAPGSSPLARGLPTENFNQLADAGIIPARAGFTSKRIAGSSTSLDHPRSRGVYGAPTW